MYFSARVNISRKIDGTKTADSISPAQLKSSFFKISSVSKLPILPIITEQNAAEAQHHAEYRVGHSYKCIAGLEQSHGFQRKAGECGEAAAEADLQEQNQPWIEMSAFNGKGRNVADAESTEYVDEQRHDRQAILRPQRDHAQQIAADSAARAAGESGYNRKSAPPCPGL